VQRQPAEQRPAATVLIGDKLGLYAAMGDGRPVTPARLAERTGCDERYLAEWLAAQAASGYAEYDPASGYAEYDPATGTFRLTEEQAFALTSENNPLFAPGGLQVAASTIKDVDLLAEAIRTGRGVDWGEHHPDLFAGTDRFFKPNYIGNLVDSWLPALDGVVAKLEAGAKVADVGCGYGASTILIAQAYPNSTFLGTDAHGPSIEDARKAAAQAGVADRVRFEAATAKDYPGGSLRPGRLLRLPARHGRPGRRRRPRPRHPRRRRHLADRRAARRRPAGGEPQPGRPDLLLRIHADLRARIPQPGGRARARRPGR